MFITASGNKFVAITKRSYVESRMQLYVIFLTQQPVVFRLDECIRKNKIRDKKPGSVKGGKFALKHTTYANKNKFSVKSREESLLCLNVTLQ